MTIEEAIQKLYGIQRGNMAIRRDLAKYPEPIRSILADEIDAQDRAINMAINALRNFKVEPQ